jgi:dolichyl-phosphate-mannose--protein O-mannosyl transferase
VVLAVVYLLGLVLGPDPSTAVLRKGVSVESALLRRRVGAAVAGTVVVLCVACFAFFWPIYTAQVIPYESWARRMWLPSWI